MLFYIVFSYHLTMRGNREDIRMDPRMRLNIHPSKIIPWTFLPSLRQAYQKLIPEWSKSLSTTMHGRRPIRICVACHVTTKDRSIFSAWHPHAWQLILLPPFCHDCYLGIIVWFCNCFYTAYISLLWWISMCPLEEPGSPRGRKRVHDLPEQREKKHSKMKKHEGSTGDKVCELSPHTGNSYEITFLFYYPLFWYIFILITVVCFSLWA